MEKKVIILIAAIVVIAIGAIFFTFFYTKKCSDVSCFNSALLECFRASYIDDARDLVWLYEIKGKYQDKCRVKVKLLEVKEGLSEASFLEGKEMMCSLPLGTVAAPQENLKNCHGLLKEGMQELIINRLHSYIVDNLGQISEELNKPL